MTPTPTPIAETRLTIYLDRERELIGDVNWLRGYERASGKFYWDTMLHLFEFAEKQQRELPADLPDGKRSIAQQTRMGLQMLRHVSVDDLAMLLWAACHEYHGKKTVWPLTVDEVGSFLRPQETFRILNLIIQLHQQNSPDRNELGEAKGAETRKVVTIAEAAPREAERGGAVYIESLSDAFGSESLASAA